MSLGTNKWHGIGNLGKDPEKGSTNSGNTVANFKIACTERVKKADGTTKEYTEWVKIVVYGKFADTCLEFIKKGSLVYVEGRLQTRKWTDVEGTDHYVTEIVAGTVRFLDGLRKSTGSGHEVGDYGPDEGYEAGIPF